MMCGGSIIFSHCADSQYRGHFQGFSKNEEAQATKRLNLFFLTKIFDLVLHDIINELFFTHLHFFDIFDLNDENLRRFGVKKN